MKAAPVVFLHGEESFLIDRELAAVEAECGASGPEDLNREVWDGAEKSAAEAVASARTLPFFGGRRLIVVKNAQAWNAAQWELLAAYAKAPNPSTCLVLIADKIDKRRNAWKVLEKNARVAACPHPADAELPGWTRKMGAELGLDLGPRVVQSLVLRVGPDLQLLWREIVKLKAYAGEGGKVSEEDVEKLVGQSRGTTVFVLCDALGERDLAQALRGLRRLLELGEHPVLLVYMIARHFRILWKAREVRDAGGRASGEAAAKIGVPPFVAKKALDQAARWSREEFERVFMRLALADLSLKSGGGAEVLDQLIIDLCGQKKVSNKRAGR